MHRYSLLSSDWRPCLPLIVFLTVFLGGSAVTTAANGPRLNEFMASNGSSYQDGQGNWPDWIELHNPHDSNINLEGWGLSDDPEKTPWPLPAVDLAANEHLIVFASGEDRAEYRQQILLKGGGRDIWDREDSFAYYYVELAAASFTFTARVDGLNSSQAWAKAGLMIRANTHVGSAHASLFQTGGNGVALQHRSLYRGFSEHVAGPHRSSGESVWLRLVREQTWVHAYLSDDGKTFSRIGSVEVKHLRDDKVLVGLALSSHLEREAAQVRFAHVTVDGQALREMRPLPVAAAIGSRVPVAASEQQYWELHTDFALAAAGEFLGLYNPQGRLVEGFSFGQQYRDISYGRVPDTDLWAFFADPTPGTANTSPPHVGTAPIPQLLPTSGRYSAGITVSAPVLSGTTPLELRFTLDGSEPTADDPLWESDLDVDELTVLRLRAFAEDHPLQLPIHPSPTVSRTFLIGEDLGLPVLSILTDPDHLHHQNTGLLLHPWNSGRDWERPAEAALLARDGTLLWQYTNLGLRIHGGASRGVDKKSFRLYWRQGQAIAEPFFFLQPDINGYRRLVVRGGGNDQVTGYDGEHAWTLLRDAVMAELARQNGGLSSSHFPVLYLLNGDLQGIYNLRERIDAYFVENHTDIAADSVDLLKVEFSQRIIVRAGSGEDWMQLLSWLQEADLSDPEQFSRAEAWLDIADFTDYYLMQIYAGNWDWPQNNMYMYREHKEGAQWRFILWDLDDAFGFRAPWDHNTLAWALRDRGRPDLAPPWYDTYGAFSLDATLIMRRLLDNREYREYFEERLDTLLAGVLEPNHVQAEIDAAAALLRPALAWEIRRWVQQEKGLLLEDGSWTTETLLSSQGQAALAQWEQRILDMKQWAAERPDHLRRHWQEYRLEVYSK